MKIRTIIFCAVVSTLPLFAVQAQVPTDDARQLELQYKGKLVKVRTLLSDSKIRYDAAGNLVGKWHAGRWTWHSTVEVTKVDLKDRTLKVKANRVILNYNRGTHLFTPVRSDPIEFEIEISPDTNGKINLTKEWDKAFLAPSEDYPLDMQPYWKPFISCVLKPDTNECRFYEKKSWEPDVYKVNPPPPDWKPSHPGAYSVGGAVKPPKVKSRVQPEYTDIAKNHRLSGTVLLEAVVTKSGGVRITRVIRPLGYGLEENAAEALSQWVFEPGTRNGEPVDVVLYVEVNFKLQP